MELSVVGKQIDIGEALRSHVEANFAAAISKYFDRPGRGHVTFSREGQSFRCDCAVHFDSGILMQSTAVAPEIYASFEAACEHMEKRVRRYKRRLKKHHNNRQHDAETITASAYVIASEPEGQDETEDTEPLIIAETTTDVKLLTVGEAVMQMDLADSSALIFRNSAHGGINVVYRRPDGNIGWIDLRR